MGPVLRDYRAVRRAYRPGNTVRYYRPVLPDGITGSVIPSGNTGRYYRGEPPGSLGALPPGKTPFLSMLLVRASRTWYSESGSVFCSPIFSVPCTLGLFLLPLDPRPVLPDGITGSVIPSGNTGRYYRAVRRAYRTFPVIPDRYGRFR